MIDVTGAGNAFAINDAGQVTGSFVMPSGYSGAFIYANGVMTDLGAFRANGFSVGFAINTAGQVTGIASPVGTNNNGVTHAFLYSNGVMTDIGTLGGHMVGRVETTCCSRSTRTATWSGPRRSPAFRIRTHFCIAGGHERFEHADSSRLRLDATETGPGRTATAGLTVSPPAPVLQFSAASVDLGSVAIGSTAAGSVDVRNVGRGPMSIAAIAAEGAGFSATSSCPASLSSGSNCTVNVQFAPTVHGPQAGALRVDTMRRGRRTG
jgi:probable HAF family extracellular repeat protein